MRLLRSTLLVAALVAPAIVACGSADDSMVFAGSPEGSYGRNPACAGEADVSGETYGKLVENDRVETATQPVSTFGVDVDTGSYSLMRRDIRAGRLPNVDGVRVEEYLNLLLDLHLLRESTLQVIAKDAKIQIELDPTFVSDIGSSATRTAS